MTKSRNIRMISRPRQAHKDHGSTPGPIGRYLGLTLIFAASFTTTMAYAQSPTSSSAAVSSNAQTGSNQVVASSSANIPIVSTNVVPLSASGASIPTSTVPVAALPPTSSIVAANGAPLDPYAQYQWKGLNLNLPSPLNTIDPDPFGLRKKLAEDYGIGYIGVSVNTFYDNVLRHAHSGPQVYAGQKPTGISQNFIALTFDLGRYGIPDGQIVVAANYTSASWNALGPTTINLATLSYYQSLFNRRLDVKVGLLQNNYEYVGTFTGGNLAGGVFGPSGSLFSEAGGSALSVPAYGVSLTGHITRNFYDKFGIDRGVTPLGVVLEHNFNPTGTRFSTPRTGAWIINELGYLRPAAPDEPQTWVRAGGVYSAGHYTEQDHPQRTDDHNYFLYLLADRQIIQTVSTPGQAYRGLYAGFSIEYVPPNLNLFSQYYEARVYGLGLLPHRRFDQISLVATDTVFSNFAYGERQAAHQLAHADSKAITGSYSFHVTHGLYLNAALAYINHPSPLTYTGSTGSALNVIGGAALFY